MRAIVRVNSTEFGSWFEQQSQRTSGSAERRGENSTQILLGVVRVSLSSSSLLHFWESLYVMMHFVRDDAK